MSFGNPVYLVAAGHAHPDTELSSGALERTVPGLSPGWSERYLGITTRRVLGTGEQVNDLAVTAVGAALDEVVWPGESIDVIICGSGFPDQVLPAAASHVAKVHSRRAVAFDVSAACASFLYALSTTSLLLQNTSATRGVAYSAEHSTAYADYTDRRSCVFWGDSAGAVLLTTENPDGPCFEVVDIELNGDHEFPDKVFVPRNGYFRSDARYSFRQVMELGSGAARAVMRRNGVDPSTVVGAAVHQASTNVVNGLSERLGVPVDRQWHNYEWAGNQSAAGVVTAFSQGWREHRSELREGDHVILAVVGGGYAGAAALLRWVS